MTVYLDDVRNKHRGMIMCHMWADTAAELHAMARQIGLARKHYQCPPKASWPHYDVGWGKRNRALSFGAVLTDRYGGLYHRAKLRGDMAEMERIDAIRAERKASSARERRLPGTEHD